MSFLDWFTPKQVLADKLSEIETREWVEENNFTGNVSDMRNASRRFIQSEMKKCEIVRELDMRQGGKK